jgi:hypothetical protein
MLMNCTKDHLYSFNLSIESTVQHFVQHDNMYHSLLATCFITTYHLYNIPYKEGEPLLPRSKDNYQMVLKYYNWQFISYL